MDPDGGIVVKNPEFLLEADRSSPLIFEFASGGDEGTSQALVLGLAAKALPLSGLNYTSPLDPFMMRLKVSLILAILISLPVWVWQIWLFVAPGLTDKEKRVVRPMLIGAIGLFPLGASFAYVMLYLIFSVMLTYQVEGIVALYSIDKYFKLMTNMVIVFGFIFELPLIIAMLARVGIVTPAFLRHYRRHIYIVLALVSMLVTPGDPWSMIAALIPLFGLFEISIWIAGVMAMLRRADEPPEEGTT